MVGLLASILRTLPGFFLAYIQEVTLVYIPVDKSQTDAVSESENLVPIV